MPLGKEGYIGESEGLSMDLDFTFTCSLTLDKDFIFCSPQLSIKWAQWSFYLLYGIVKIRDNVGAEADKMP